MTRPDVGLLVDRLRAHGLTIAVAESLTAGLVCARLGDVPGVSDVLRGGVVAYATDLKATLLDVPQALLASRGPVDADVAAAMASGVRRRCQADMGLATTGVAGPGPQDGFPVGTVHVAVDLRGTVSGERLLLPGDRAAVREAAVDAILLLAQQALDDHIGPR